MWTIKYLKLNNFRSHQKTRFAFNQGIVSLIYGINQDDEGADSNGAGKSTLIEGITVGLLDMVNKDVLQEEFIMDGTDSSEIEISLFNTFTKNDLVINRIYSRGKSEVLSIYEHLIKRGLVSVAEGNKYILEQLEISKDDLLDYFLISQGNSSSFFKSSDGDKKRIIGRFTNSAILDNVFKLIDSDMLELQNAIYKKKTTIDGYDSKIEVYNEELENENQNKQAEQEERKTLLLNRLKETTKQIEKSKEELKQKKKEVSSMLDNEDNLKRKLEGIDVESANQEIAKKKIKISEFEENLTSVRKIRNENNKLLQDSVDCPKCKYEFSLSSPDTDLKKVKKTVKECDEMIINIEKEIDSTEKQIKILKITLTRKEEAKEELESFQFDLKREYNKQTSISDSIQDKKEILIEIQSNIKTLGDLSLNKKRIKELKDHISTLNAANERLDEEIDKLQAELDEINYWKIQFGLSGFSTYLANKVLFLIEGYVNKYLKDFHTNLSVKINGFKVLKSGKVSEKIDVLVGKNNINYSNFKRFSGGQKQRINTCGILALQRMINMTCKNGGLDLLCLDEFFEGLDEKGQDRVLNILELSRVTTLVVTHQNNNINYPNQIIVNYKNAISTIN